MYAAAFGHREIVLLLLAAFKKLHHIAVQGQRNGQGLTACQLAEKNGHEDIASLLKFESQVFGRPAGPSAFVPAHPLDLDRPPTPTETTPLRSSLRRLKTSGRNNTVPPLPDPTAPLPPTCQSNSSSCLRDSFETDSRRTRCKAGNNPFSGRTLAADSRRTLCKGTNPLYDKPRTAKGSPASVPSSTPDVNVELEGINSVIGTASVIAGIPVPGITVAKSLERKDIESKDLIFRDLSIARCKTNRYTSRANSVVLGNIQDKLAKDKESSENTRKKPEGENTRKKPEGENTRKKPEGENTRKKPESENKEVLILQNKNVRDEVERSQNLSDIEKSNKLPPKTGLSLISAPDAIEREVLEELMKDLAISYSPGSGNEADTESLMECEGSPREGFGSRMNGPNNRKMTVTGVPLAVAALTSPNESMPKIDLSSSTRSLNRSIQHLVHEDSEIRPGQRPPTPARPSLPTLIPGRLVDVSLNSSVTSTKSEGRYAPPPRRVTFSTFPRSSSEPRSLATSPRPQQNPDNDYDDEDSDEPSSDILDSSTRSEGWDHLRGARGRGPPYTTVSEGHVVTLPPINQPKYTEAGIRGREGTRGRGGIGLNAQGENVLNVAKKTLEQLETVLAPSETSALSRAIPRTRATQQIHLET